jgi:uncharacterized protein
MKIWIDLAGPPQVLFFRPILREFERRGYQIMVTTRAYGQTNKLAERFGIPYTNIGQHGGRSFLELMRQNYLRSFDLVRWARHQDIDLAISHNSYSQAVAARLLGIPFVTSMDYEHQPLNHLCFRLAQRVIVPKPFPDEALKKYGARRKAVRYSGLKEEIYLADFVPTANFRQGEGIPLDKPLVVIRPPAPWTAYHRFENDIFDQMLVSLAGHNDAYILFLPRIPSQVESVRNLHHIHIAEKVYDGPDLLYHADVVISGGGTMNREAAVLGTPTYTIFRGKMGAVDQFLIDGGRMARIATEADIPLIQVIQKTKKNLFQRNPNLVEEIATLYSEKAGAIKTE